MNRCTLLNSLWELSVLPETRRFRRALARPRAAQEAVLARILRRNAGTEFGREHGFGSIRSPEEYRARVPVRGYQELGPWLDEAARGTSRILTAEPVLRLVPTSGSTRGRKLIPWTRSLGVEMRRALAPWVAGLFRQMPELKGGPAYWSVSPALEPDPPAGTPAPEPEPPAGTPALEPDPPAGTPAAPGLPVGFDGDSAYLGGVLGRLVRPLLAVPEDVARLREPEAFQFATLVALLRCRELRLVSVWHPTFFLLLLDRLESGWDRLLEGVERGGSGPELGGSGAGVAAPPAPERARELARLGPGRVERIWPRLGLISCWTDAGAARSARELGERFPGVALQGKGLLATEAFSSLPFQGARPLALRTHFFELLDEDGRAHLAHELREGATYTLVVTTSGGLYRYLTHDRVHVTGWVGAAPSIRFVGRGDRVSDLRGEKLTDAFVQGVLDRLVGADPRVRFAMLAPDSDGATAGYTLFLEAPSDAVAGVAPRLDALLSENPHYRYARGLGQLRPPTVVQAPEGAERAYLEAAAARSGRLGGVKPAALAPPGMADHGLTLPFPADGG